MHVIRFGLSHPVGDSAANSWIPMKTTQEQVPRSVAKIFDARIANRLADILADELIPADVVDAPPLGFEVWVRGEHFDRAKAILDATPLTEEELIYLATGALGEGPGTS
jgi:hypothetical protein